MKKNNKTLIFLAIILIAIICLLLISYYQFTISDAQYSTGYNNRKFSKESQKQIVINADEKLVQEFKAKKNNMEKIKINFKNTPNEEDTKLRLILKDLENDTIIKEEEINKTNIYSNNSYIIDFQQQEKSKNKNYSLTIEVVSDNNDSVTLSATTETIAKDRTVTINGEELENGTIAINEYYNVKSKTVFFNLVSISISIIAIVLSILIYLYKDISVEKAFLIVVPAMCIIFMLIMPMFKSHDEQRHWQRAYEISEGKLLSTKNNGKVEDELPASVSDTLNTYWRDIKYKSVLDSKNVSLDNNTRKTTDMSFTAVYSPIQYIPQAIGIIIARVITNKVLVMAYMARLFNMLFALTIMYLAIKITPVGKKIFLLASILPLTIEGCSSMSPDAMTISISFLFIAYILKLLFEKEKKITKKDVILLSVLSIILALCKIVYIPLVGLLLLLPETKFKSKKNKYIIVIAIIIIAIFINLAWLSIANSYLALSSDGTSGNQIKSVIQHPIEYLKVLLYSLNVNGQEYLTSLFGGTIAWNEISLYSFVPYTYCALFLFIAITDKEMKNKFSLTNKIIISLIVLAIFALIFTSLYVQYNQPGVTKIAGVQGRYFIPFIPLIAIMLNGIKLESKYKEENVIKTIAITGLILQVYVISVIVINHL